MTEEKMILGKKVNEALHYVSTNLLATGNNPKPVLFHSFKVANRLYELDYEENVVIAAALHDLIEDTAITYDDILEKYGKEIADIVKAVSFNRDIKDKYEQAKDLFNNCLKQGREALLVKCSDLVDNIDYVGFVNDDKKKELLRKYDLFLDIAKDILKDEKIYDLLATKVANAKK